MRRCYQRISAILTTREKQRCGRDILAMRLSGLSCCAGLVSSDV